MWNWLRRRRDADKVDRAASLASRPVRNRLIEWQETPDGIITLHVPLRQMRQSQGKFFARLFPPAAVRRVTLDEIGSEIWRRCDGEHSATDLLDWMRQRWQFSYKEAEIGMTGYLRTLAQRSLIVFVGPAAKAGREEPPKGQGSARGLP